MGSRIVVVDGHPAMRLGLVVLLSEAEGMQVIGETGNGDEALRIVECERPNLIVLGLNLVGEIDGVRICRIIKATPSPPRVLVHTAYDYAEDVSSCFLAGADSYLHKRADCDALLDAARRTADGERVWSLGSKVGEPRSKINVTPTGHPLTPREREVLALVLRRYSNAEIADALDITTRTVKNHVGKVLTKLGVGRRKELFKGFFERLEHRAQRAVRLVLLVLAY